jgi:hypothetical protein
VLLALASLLVGSQVLLSALAPSVEHITLEEGLIQLAPLMAALFVPTMALLALAPWLHRRLDGRVLLWAGVAVAVAMRLVHAGGPATLETDHWRYLWDGAVLAHGFNPWAVSPQDAPGAPWLAGLIADGNLVWRQVWLPQFRSIYPGTAQAAFALAHLIAPWSLDGLRLVMGAAELATLALLAIALRATGRPPAAAALYACQPLVAFVAGNQAHVDALMPPLLLAALLLASGTMTRQRAAGAGLLIGLAAGVKLWPVLLAPLMLRRLWPHRGPSVAFTLAVGAALAAATGPLFLSALQPGSGLTAYAQGWSINNGLYEWTRLVLDTAFPGGVTGDAMWRAAAALVTAGLALAVAVRPPRDLDDLAGRALVLATAVWLVSPAQFPWYMLWFLPLAVLRLEWPLIALPVLAPLYYLFFPMNGPVFMFVLAPLQVVPFLIWLAVRHWPAAPTRATA